MILVVDDDPRILSATRAILVEQDFAVSVCSDGQTALDTLAGHPEIKLVISDVLMPGMKGTDMVRIAKLARPDLRILFMSGDIGDTKADDFGDHALLSKPFTASSLLQAIAKVLG